MLFRSRGLRRLRHAHIESFELRCIRLNLLKNCSLSRLIPHETWKKEFTVSYEGTGKPLADGHVSDGGDILTERSYANLIKIIDIHIDALKANSTGD